MKRIILVSFSVLILTISSFSQISNQTSVNLIERVRASKYLDTLHIDNRFEGSPYLDDNYSLGSISLNNGFIFDSLMLRYNVYNDNMEFLVEGQPYSVAGEGSIKEIRIGDKTFRFIPYVNKAKQNTGYMESNIIGYCSLYTQYQIKLLKGEPSLGYTPATSDHFEKTPPLFFIRIENKRATYISNQSDLINYLEGNQEDVEAFIKKQKLNVKKFKDLSVIVHYINELQMR